MKVYLLHGIAKKNMSIDTMMSSKFSVQINSQARVNCQKITTLTLEDRAKCFNSTGRTETIRSNSHLSDGLKFNSSIFHFQNMHGHLGSNRLFSWQVHGCCKACNVSNVALALWTLHLAALAGFQLCLKSLDANIAELMIARSNAVQNQLPNPCTKIGIYLHAITESLFTGLTHCRDIGIRRGLP